MKHYMHLKEKPFRSIWEGNKTIELRLYDEKRRAVKVGDQIEFDNLSNPGQLILVNVTAIHTFESFAKLYETLPLEKCGYAVHEVRTAAASDMNEYYSLEEQLENGVVGIEFVVAEKRNRDLIRISRFLSLVLRHKPEAAEIALDSNGWARVDELIVGVSKKYPIDMDVLELIVKKDDKQRYSFNEDRTMIRANQGHSVDVDVELEKVIPPQFLWHGTAEKYVQSIEENGLIPKTRLYVHLSSDIDTARKVGARHGEVVVYRVDALKMHQDGVVFYRSANQVWLVKSVPKEYLVKTNF